MSSPSLFSLYVLQRRRTPLRRRQRDTSHRRTVWRHQRPAPAPANTWSICPGDGPRRGGDVALLRPVGSALLRPARSALSIDAGEPVRLGPWSAGFHGMGGRARFAGILFCGSVVNVIGTGPIDIDRSNSNRPYIVGGAGRPSRLAANAIPSTWCIDPGGGPACIGIGGCCIGWRPYSGPIGAAAGFGAPGWGMKRLSRICGGTAGRFGLMGRACGWFGWPGGGMTIGLPGGGDVAGGGA